jgi:uncharacterized protein YjdB
MTNQLERVNAALADGYAIECEIGAGGMRAGHMRRLMLVPLLAFAFACGDGPMMQPPSTPVVASVEITPASVSFDALGAGAQLTAEAKDGSGSTISGKSFTWASSDASVANVDNTGLVSAVNNGSTTITATTDGVQGSSAVTVQQVVAQVEVTPDVITLDLMGTGQLTAEPQDWLGNEVMGSSIQWESSDRLVVEVFDDGSISAVSNGSAMVTATSDGKSAWAGVAVGATVWEPTMQVDATVATLAFVPGSGDLFAGVMGDGLLRSQDGGNTWSAANTGITTNVIFSVVATSQGDLFASSGDAAFRSLDGGATWTDVTSGLTGSIRQLGMGPGDEVYAGTSGGLFVSTDKGATWTLTGFINDVDRVAANSAGDLFVGTELDGLFRSTDGGSTWEDVNDDFPPNNDLVIFAIGIDPVNDDIFTCCPGGMFRSTDNGVTWTDITNGLAHVPFSLGFDSLGNLYAGTCEGGVYRTTDRGATWVPVNAGLPSLSVFGLTIDGTDRLFAGTLGDGILRSVVPGVSTVGPPSPRFCDLG